MYGTVTTANAGLIEYSPLELATVQYELTVVRDTSSGVPEGWVHKNEHPGIVTPSHYWTVSQGLRQLLTCVSRVHVE